MTEYVDTSVDTSIVPQETTVDLPQEPVKPVEKPVQAKPEVETADTDEPDDTPWPKKAANTVSRLKAEKARMRGEYSAKLQAAEAELAKYRQPQPEAKPQVQVTPQGVPKTLENGEPNILAYTSVVEYQRDVAKYDAMQLWKEQQQTSEKQQQETQQTQQAQQWLGERIAAVQEQEAKFAEEHPKAIELFEEYKDVVEAYPPHIKQAILECENVPLAMLNMAEAGKIEELGRMSYAQAARALAKAELTPITKPQTQAPKPLATSRGAVAGGKDPSQMTDAEFNAWRRASIAGKR